MDSVDLVIFRGRGFSLSLPGDWQYLEGFLGAEALFAAPPAADSFRTTINIVRLPAPQHVDLERLAGDTVDALSQSFTDFLLIEQSRATFADEWEAVRLVFGYRQGLFLLTGDQWLTLRGGTSWTLTATCDSDAYADWAPLLRACLESFAVETHGAG